MQISQFLLILSLLCLSLSINNTTSITISIKKCEFTIIPPQQNFTFISCMTNEQIQYFQWQKCVDFCCKGISGQAYSITKYQTLMLCEQIRTQDIDRHSSVMVIGIVIAATFVLIGIFIIFCKILSMICRNRVTNTQQTQENYNSLTLSHDISRLIWQKCTQKQYISQQTVCSICLQPQCYTKLPCNHIYHPQCIGKWLQKSYSCPNCNQNRIKRIKQYCYRCHMRYFILKRRIFQINPQNMKKLTCKQCTRQQKNTEEQAFASTGWKFEQSHNKMQKSTQVVLGNY